MWHQLTEKQESYSISNLLAVFRDERLSFHVAEDEDASPLSATSHSEHQIDCAFFLDPVLGK